MGKGDRPAARSSVGHREPGRGDDEFTVHEVVAASKEVLEKPFSSSHVNQMLSSLSGAGLIYKNRWGKYSFAVPLFDRFIERQVETSTRSTA